MKKTTGKFTHSRRALWAVSALLLLGSPIATAQGISTTQAKIGVSGMKKVNPNTVDVVLSDGHRMTLDFYGDNIFRLFRDDNGGILRDPKSTPEARILVENPRRAVSKISVYETADKVVISTGKIRIEVDKKDATLKVFDKLKGDKMAFEMTEPIAIGKNRATITLREDPNEYFFGGGVQNGRFSHKGKVIAIENQNSWTDGGVASPTPFYWSTNGYGVLWHTFKKGQYDFGASDKGVVKLSHDDNYLDMFFMVNDGAVPLLNDFYQLTGNPVLIPKFGFYQGHLNAYNRDYWKENEKGVPFEDGKRYSESQTNNGGVKESLNGEKNNYQFSARAVIDRYLNNDMPIGWLLPNDGYGAGYGQTSTLDSNIQNLKNLAEYAHKNGVEIGLWTQSDLHPKPEISALLQRDIVKEVRDAGVRVLKTDVAWVGAGYSFGLNGITDVAQIMTYYGNNSRPFIISLDGWAGTQRYAGIWSGDQTGGNWEYIRFHIPTYIGSGLSGQPNITSDMDGIFGGKNMAVNTRDFQWKTFTPMELNMDGWGANEKYPHALGEPATSINRWYLKLKSELLPYAYSVAAESVDGLPMIRAMFLENPNPYTLGKATQYQFMYGPSFLVAPIYQATAADTLGNDIRDGIYLPEGRWIDYFTGDTYKGGRVINNFASPIWKTPVFVSSGAIIPMTAPNNNVAKIDPSIRIYELYPDGQSSFVEYDDDGKSVAYMSGTNTSTRIESNLDNKNTATLTIAETVGDFEGFERNKSTELRFNVTEKPKKVTAKIGGRNVKLTEVSTIQDFASGQNVYYYDQMPNLNKFATRGSDFAKVSIVKNPQMLIKLAKTDITVNDVVVRIDGYRFAPADNLLKTSGSLAAPKNARVTDENTEAYTLTPTWDAVHGADYYEIEFRNMLYSTIRNLSLLFDQLAAETDYSFRLRAVNKDGASDWTTFTAKTKANPLEFAIAGIVGRTTAENQGGSLKLLFDMEEGDLWHTKYNINSVPFDLTMDLRTINRLDKFQYSPRDNAGNGNILKGSVAYSMDNETWTEAGKFEWARNNEVKVFTFADAPQARYIKVSVTEAVGGYGSGKELYVFKVPGTESYLPGDINNDGIIDRNDLVSYTNYTGLRRGDADFEGYISNGDINRNDLIDAYDISLVGTQIDLEEDQEPVASDTVAGRLTIRTAKPDYAAGETINVVVRADGLKAVNALSFALTYDPMSYEFVSIDNLNVKQMENLTKDRLHTNGTKALYPTFVNIGVAEPLSGNEELMAIKFKAKRNVKFDLSLTDGLLVDRELRSVRF